MNGPSASEPDSESSERTPVDFRARRRCTFPRRLRVIRKADFEQAVRHGPRVVDRLVTVWGRRNGLPHARLGLIVGRKHGGAPQRNRIKRVLREAFRLSQHDLPAGIDLICAPRLGVEITLAGGRKSLMKHAKGLEQRLARSTAGKCGEDTPRRNG